MNNNSLSREQQETIRNIREREVRRGGIVERKKTVQFSTPPQKRIPLSSQTRWEKTYSGRGYSLIRGYAVAGYTYSQGAGDANAWIIKLDSESNKLWEKNYIINPSIWVGFILQTYDGSYATAGWTSGPKGFGSADAWLLKLDEKGNLR